MTPGMELSPAIHPGVRVEVRQEAHGRDPQAQIQWVQWLLGEVAKPVVQELREKQREPRELEQTLERLKVHDVRAKSSSLVSGEQGPKQDRLAQHHPNGTSLAFKKHQVVPAQLPWQPQRRDS